MQLLEQVEVMHVDLGPLVDGRARQEMVDCLGCDAPVTDGRGQQVRADDVAAGEMLLALPSLVAGHDVDEALAVVEFAETFQIAHLADGRDDDVALDLELGAGLGLGRHAFHRALAHLEPANAAIRVHQHLERHDAALDIDALAQRHPRARARRLSSFRSGTAR